ncbi:hypothetical protein [Streptomyces albidoflavus]|uniref:hypothetical protein n=1 Tax=Streptomyces albidoflavus TaxID=1886 RepID=UPI001F5DF700|nr:hypothetical protein [Streptomyces albidoflavus]
MTTSAGTPPQKNTGATRAVLYVCADRGALMPTLGSQRAQMEGQHFADERGLTITEIITDSYGEPDPTQRKGWQRVRELTETGAVSVVLIRWPAALAPDSAHELRHRESLWLQQQGVRLLYTWPPLAKIGGEK